MEPWTILLQQCRLCSYKSRDVKHKSVNFVRSSCCSTFFWHLGGKKLPDKTDIEVVTEKVVTNKSGAGIVLRCYDCLLQEVKEIKFHLSPTCCYHSPASYFLMGRTLKTFKHESWCLIWMTQLNINCLYHHHFHPA